MKPGSATRANDIVTEFWRAKNGAQNSGSVNSSIAYAKMVGKKAHPLHKMSSGFAKD